MTKLNLAALAQISGGTSCPPPACPPAKLPACAPAKSDKCS